MDCEDLSKAFIFAGIFFGTFLFLQYQDVKNLKEHDRESFKRYLQVISQLTKLECEIISLKGSIETIERQEPYIGGEYGK